MNAELAGPRGQSKYSLSPGSLLHVAPETRIVLPSPNGSTLTLATGDTPTFAGCFRNARAVAEAALLYGPKISVIPAGERWQSDDTLRPSFEDLIGAGAIIRHLEGALSPEAQLATTAFHGATACLLKSLQECSSGKELTGMGYGEDIALIAELDVDACAPILKDGAYRNMRTTSI